MKVTINLKLSNENSASVALRVVWQDGSFVAKPAESELKGVIGKGDTLEDALEDFAQNARLVKASVVQHENQRRAVPTYGV